MRSMVKRILRAHGYPPDKQEATLTVRAQADCERFGGLKGFILFLNVRLPLAVLPDSRH